MRHSKKRKTRQGKPTIAQTYFALSKQREVGEKLCCKMCFYNIRNLIITPKLKFSYQKNTTIAFPTRRLFNT